jgi:hypothetical protein
MADGRAAAGASGPLQGWDDNVIEFPVFFLCSCPVSSVTMLLWYLVSQDLSRGNGGYLSTNGLRKPIYPANIHPKRN